MSGGPVFAVCAHPDDEVLGAGGTLARFAAEGREVHLLFLADGVGSRGDGGVEDSRRRRRAMGDKAAGILGAQPPAYVNLPDNRLDGVDLLDIIVEIERFAAPIRPELVLTHFAGDLNVDHRLCAQAAVTAFRPTPGQSVKAIYSFEVPSSTEWAFGVTGQAFAPDAFFDIAPYLDVKLEALNAYEEEMRPYPHPRSPDNVTALARYRGASVGLAAAEAFALVRMVHG